MAYLVVLRPASDLTAWPCSCSRWRSSFTSSCSAPTGSTGWKVRAPPRPAPSSRCRRCRPRDASGRTSPIGAGEERAAGPPSPATGERGDLGAVVVSFDRGNRPWQCSALNRNTASVGVRLIGGDLFDFWVGPFFVGFFGVTTIFFTLVGTALIVYGAAIGPTWNLWQISIAPPDLKYGLALAPLKEGGIWQIITVCAIGAFCVMGAARGGDLPQTRHGLPRAVRFRRCDLCLRHAGGHPAAAAGRLGTRLPLRHHQPPRLGVEHGLPVSPFPLQSCAHDRRVVLLHDDLGAVAARLRSCYRPRTRSRATVVKTSEHENTFFRDTIGYSIGTLGIHRLGLFLALSAGFWSAVCIIISGPFWTRGWPEWWTWWLDLPIWS